MAEKGDDTKPVKDAENVYDEVNSVGFVNPTYMDLNEVGVTDMVKPPLEPPDIGSYSPRAQPTIITPPVVLPVSTLPLDEERKKWRGRMLMVVLVFLVIIAAFIVGLAVLATKEQGRREVGPQSARLVGADGRALVGPVQPPRCKDTQIMRQNGKCIERIPTAAPVSASIIVGCHPPTGKDDKAYINDLCWVNETTLIVAMYVAEQVLLFKVDADKRSCDVQVLDSGYQARRVSCSPTGDFYVSAPLDGFVKIFYKNGSTTIWNITGIPAPRNIAVNDDLLVLDHNGTSPFLVFNHEREVVGTVSVAGDMHEILYTYLTWDGLLVATGHLTHELYIHNMKTNVSITTAGFGQEDGKFDSPGDVSYTSSGHILIGDWQNHRVSVFTREGKFLHHLNFTGGKHLEPNGVSVIPRSGKTDMMAVAPFPDPIIWIQELH